MIQTPKTDWRAADGLPDDALNRIELNTKLIREEPNLPLVVEVRADYPSHKAGRIIFHTGEGKVKISNGTAWI